MSSITSSARSATQLYVGYRLLQIMSRRGLIAYFCVYRCVTAVFVDMSNWSLLPDAECILLLYCSFTEIIISYERIGCYFVRRPVGTIILARYII